MNTLNLILFIPLAGFLISGLLGSKLPEKVTGWISSIAILLSFVFSLNIFNQLSVSAEPIKSKLFTFLSVGNLTVDFAIQADRLTSVMMLVITGIGFLIHIYSIAYMHGDKGFYKFFAYLNLFVFNMLVLVMGSNFLMLFFGWEGVGLCSYLLIGFWYSNQDYGKAARKAFVMNRIGDLGLLLGLFLIVWQTQSLDYDVVLKKFASGEIAGSVTTAICVLLFIGAMGKSAQIPLYTWLPDAMAGPTPVSALIHAATMVTAGVYLVVRCNAMYSLSADARTLILWVGMATSILAALIGLKQNDIKKVLAYSTVSQLGLMFIALGVGAYTAAMFHLITHAFFKALLFLGSGSVIHAMGGEQDIRKMGGLKKSMPLTYWTFLIGTLAISGMPFFSGFFSKDEILASIFSHNRLVWGLTVISAFITAFYMFRVFMVTFLGGFRGTEDQKNHLHESPVLITLPLIILAVLSLVGGFINLPELLFSTGALKLKHFLLPIIGDTEAQAHHLDHATEYLLIAVTVAGFILAFVFTYMKYIKKQAVPETDEEITGAGKVLASKFYVDEMYDLSIVSAVNSTGDGLKATDKGIFTGIMSGVNAALLHVSALYSRMQNGRVHYYLIFMIVGLFFLLAFNYLKTLWN